MNTRSARWRPWAVVFGLAVTYFVTTRMGLGLALPPDQKATAIWPPSGIAFAAVLLFGLRVWPGIWLGAFLTNLWDAFDATKGGSFGAHLVSSGVIALGSTLQALAGAILIRRFVGLQHPLDRARDVFQFAVVAFAMCLTAATFGVVSLCTSGLVPWPAFVTVWWTWWLGDAVGVLLITPVILTWSRSVPATAKQQIRAEAVGMLVLTIVVCVLVFGAGSRLGVRASPLAYLSLPFLVWGSVRFGSRGAAMTVMVIAVFAVWSTVNGTGPFVGADVYESLLLLDIFLAVAVVTSLVLCAVLREREEAESALRGSEAQFRQLASAVPQIVWTTASNGATVYLNQRWVEYTGLTGATPDELARVIHPDDLSRMTAEWEVSHKAGTAFQYEFRLRSVAGSEYRWFLARAVPVTGPDGARGGWFGTSTDIEELKRTQTELTQQRADLQLILDTVPALIFHKDRNHRLVHVNNELVRVVGLSREAIEGRTDSELGSTHHDNYQDEEDIMTGGHTVRGLIEPLDTPAGIRWLQTTKLPYRDETGRITGIIGFSVDITERKLAEEEVQRLNTELEQRVADRTALAETRAAEFQSVVETLREQEQVLRTVLDSLGEAILVADRTGTVTLQNRAFNRLHAIAPSGPITDESVRVYGVYQPDGNALCPVDELPLIRAIRGVPSDNVNLLIRSAEHPNGVPVSVTGRPIFGPTGVEGGVIAIRDVTAVQVTEAVLRESQERYALAVRGSQDGIWDWDMRTGSVYYSPRWKDMLGYAEHEVQNRFDEWERLIHPDDLPGAKTALGAYLDGTAGSFGLELRMLHKDGAYRWIYTRGVVQSGLDGRPYRMGGSHTDVTARRVAEAALRESEAQFRQTVEAAFDAIVTIDSAGRVVGWNRGAERVFGYTVAETLGRDIAMVIPNRYVEAHRSALAAFDPNRPSDVRGILELIGVRKTGDEFPIEVALTHWMTKSGQRFTAIARDVTERHRATAALRASEERFRAIFDQTFQFIGLMLPDGTLVEGNRTALDAAGVSEADVLGKPFWETPWWTHDPAQQDRLRDAVIRANCGETVRFEATHRMPDGETIWVDFSLKPFHDGMGKVSLLIPEGRDITNRKRAETALLASVHEKEVMLKEIHHRVKNNLQIISTLLELQSDGITDPAALASFRESRGRVRSMALIHERLYRSENLASVEFGTYVQSLAEDLFRAYRADDEAVRLTVSVSVPPVPLDLAIPCGLLVNELISNCLKYAFAGREGGIINVSLEFAGTGWYVLSVADDGVGVPAEFNFRHTPSFGLQLTNTLAEQLGGKLSLDRSGGTRFTVRFPLRG